MRLDKYLKVSRLIKRRTIAAEACGAERVQVNGKAAKPSHEVKIGDILEIRFGSNVTKVEVLNTAEHATRDNASALYKELPS